MGGSSPKQPEAPKYTSADGRIFDDPNKAANRDRRVQLASAFGYNPASNGGFIDPWIATQSPEVQAQFREFDTQGLTAADYRAENRIKEQTTQQTAAEDQRKAAIASGRSAVDTSLGAFDDNYFSNIAKTVQDYYLPQIETQFGDANEQLTYDIARKGQLKSQSAIERKAKLQGKYDLEKANIGTKAANAAQQARDSVASTKNVLYGMAESSADPAAVNTALGSETARLRAYQPELTPMGQVFADYVTPVINTVGAGLSAEANGYKGFNTGIFSPKTSNNYTVAR
jgi:hypothetical protein